MNDFDSPWKEALGRWFEPFLLFFYHDIHADIDWTRGYELLDQELQAILPEAAHGRRHVDKLVKVWLRHAGPVWLLIHIEVQTEPEEEFAKRMLIYHIRLVDRYDVEVNSLAVLADASVPWRPAHYRFRPVKLLDYRGRMEQLEQDANSFATITLAHLKALETRQDVAGRLHWKVRLVRGLYERGWDAEQLRQLFRMIDWMLDLPATETVTFREELQRIEEERAMPFVTSVERLAKQEGHLEGRREELLAGLELTLELKYGAEGLALLPELQQIQDLERLKAIQQAIRTTATAAELRQLWS